MYKSVITIDILSRSELTAPLGQLARWIREREMPGSTLASEMDRNSDSDHSDTDGA